MPDKSVRVIRYGGFLRLVPTRAPSEGLSLSYLHLQFPEPLGPEFTGMLPPTSTICPPLPLVTTVVLFAGGGGGGGAVWVVVLVVPLVVVRFELSLNVNPFPEG